MGYFSHLKRAPKIKFAAKYERFLEYFDNVYVQFQAILNYHQEVEKQEKK